MVKSAASMSQTLRKDQRQPRCKTKTGCRACQKQKVKCDEGWPACHCCILTGRACDVYGIWDGSNRYEQCSTGNAAVDTLMIAIETIPAPRLWIPKAPPATYMSRAIPEEQSYFNFYQHCTASHLQIDFGPSFRNSILLRTSASRPAVLRAMMALSACHKRKEVPHCLADGSNSIRKALIICLIFVLVEFLRGNYLIGYKHLQFDPPDAWPIVYWELLSSDQNFIRGALDSWLRTYDATVAGLRKSSNFEEVRRCEALWVYYIMATIVGATSLPLHKQMVYDEHMSRFLAIIGQSIKLRDDGGPLEALGNTEPADFFTTDNEGLVPEGLDLATTLHRAQVSKPPDPRASR
ncbi:hypothetical protein CC80DRAFT_506925 [Byssothecium circinans]|uniref:Zn(2)-C6 fungal-type domain-containing protein n=1 Tax=Byssothecium circinans TaxID=147558 RepID=A0A6A5TPV6_9PLEO|nr:hypothetical protein CC80DRAFT_506925 [Byssothecium circinans]